MSKYHKPLMDTAYVWAKMSSCVRRQVGAVLSKDSRILATGYNGTIKGTDNCCEESCPMCNGRGFINDDSLMGGHNCPKCTGSGRASSDFVLHAEQNVIAFCARNGIPTEGTSMYITLSPCKQCAKMIAQSGIKEVFYSIEYKDTEGIEYLRKVGVSATLLSSDTL
jgi:dCMP deaminase